MMKRIFCPARDFSIDVSMAFAGFKKQGAYPADRCWSQKDQDEMERAQRICP